MSSNSVNGSAIPAQNGDYTPLRAQFADGIKTSGQHAPYYDELRSYEDFPEEITGPTVWKAAEYQDNPERWTHQLTREEIDEISKAADHFKASGLPLLDISKEEFALPDLSKYLESVREELINGKGFVLFKGLPVTEWSRCKTAIAYMGLGAHFGKLISQNGKGHILGHIKDMHEDASQVGKIRSYRTNKGQDFHADYSDIVGLLCLARAKESGESDIVSTHHLYNTLRKERPDVLKTLIEPIWYFDRKGEVSKGQEQWTRTSVFFLEPKGSKERMFAKFDPHFFRSPTRFSSAGLIPPLSPAQLEAADVVEATCTRLQMHMVMQVGEIQFLHNQHILHRRTAYEDFEDPMPKRHLMRIWMATPEGEGGWRLPFWDRDCKRRGGVQVDDRDVVVVLDAE